MSAGMKRKAAGGAGASKVAGALEELDAAVRQQEAARAAAEAAAIAAEQVGLRAQAAGRAAFVASASFKGVRPGYYFGTGDKGTGCDPSIFPLSLPPMCAVIVGKKTSLAASPSPSPSALSSPSPLPLPRCLPSAIPLSLP